ncbi:hypothetical protein [Sphingomonas sp. AP4-R1]|uniref:hypothetical protein n=1 Tax=Sphingomonas sp. AP4-R1 TaxID=2735134 RepID=UPI0034631E39
MYSVAKPKTDLRTGLAQALKNGKVGAWLESLAPQDANYRKLSETYIELRLQGDAAPSPAIPDIAKPLQPGTTDARIPRSRGNWSPSTISIRLRRRATATRRRSQRRCSGCRLTTASSRTA